MERRDYLLRQIEMMAQVLASLIRRITGLKDEFPEEEESPEVITNELLTEHFNFNLSEIFARDSEDIPQWLTEEKEVHISNLEAFAEVLSLNARARDTEAERRHLISTAIALLNYADRQSGTFSIERQQKMHLLRDQL